MVSFLEVTMSNVIHGKLDKPKDLTWSAIREAEKLIGEEKKEDKSWIEKMMNKFGWYRSPKVVAVYDPSKMKYTYSFDYLTS